MIDLSDGPGVVSSVEALDDLLRRAEVPRPLRRHMVADARRLARMVFAAERVAPSLLRFKVIRCDCCGKLELTCGSVVVGERASGALH